MQAGYPGRRSTSTSQGLQGLSQDLEADGQGFEGVARDASDRLQRNPTLQQARSNAQDGATRLKSEAEPYYDQLKDAAGNGISKLRSNPAFQTARDKAVAVRDQVRDGADVLRDKATSRYDKLQDEARTEWDQAKADAQAEQDRRASQGGAGTSKALRDPADTTGDTIVMALGRRGYRAEMSRRQRARYLDQTGA